MTTSTLMKYMHLSTSCKGNIQITIMCTTRYVSNSNTFAIGDSCSLLSAVNIVKSAEMIFFDHES